MEYVAKCDQCGILKRGDLEECDDALENHERFHSVQIKRVATDGGHPAGPTGGAVHPDHADDRRDQAFLGSERHKCDLCDRVFDDIDDLADHRCAAPDVLLPDGGCDYDHVLVRPTTGTNRTVYHQPGEDPDQPRCDTELRARDGWLRRDPERVSDTLRLCSRCDPEHVADPADQDHSLHRQLADNETTSVDDLVTDGGSVTVTLELTIRPGSEEYKIAHLKETIGRLSHVANIEEVSDT